MPIQHLVGNDSFRDDVVKSDIPVFVDFFAEWCGPCKAAEPILEKMSDEFAGKVKIVSLDVDEPENREIAMQHQVMSIPTVVMYKDGKPVAKQVGYGGPDMYRQLIEKQAGAAKAV